MSLPDVIKRKVALAAGLMHYFTGKPCKNGHLEKRITTSGTCLGCARARAAKLYAENPQKFSDASKKWREKNPDYAKINRATINRNSDSYRRRNLPKYAAYRSQGRARKLNATPKWFGEFDELVMQEAHELARRRKVATGIEWEVDHIVPLAGKKVCGLHVGVNIQVIPRTQNRAKSNKHAVQ